MSKKERIDVLLVNKGFFATREKAQTSIMAGNVFIDNQRIDKAGTKIDISSHIELRGETMKYVSRGGLKLEKAINEFLINATGCIAMDIGASTGGFTDCLLQNGASKVYSIDVGYGQLDWSLRQDRRVVVMERTNFRYITKEQINDDIDLATIDVAFISLTKILPNLKNFMKVGGAVIALIKPQFEAGREKVGKKGVVKDKAIHFSVSKDIIEFSKSIGFCPIEFSYSPIKGPEGNIEYLLLLRYENQCTNTIEDSYILDVIQQSHGGL